MPGIAVAVAAKHSSSFVITIHTPPVVACKEIKAISSERQRVGSRTVRRRQAKPVAGVGLASLSHGVGEWLVRR